MYIYQFMYLYILLLFSYPNAHIVQVNIQELTVKERKKFENEKIAKLNREVDRLRLKHENEINALQTRMNSTYGEFKRDRAIEFENLMMRYKNKLKDVESLHKTEINAITRKKGSSMIVIL